MELDRKAILVHLKDLRDLEVAKYQIEHVVYVREESNFQNKYANLEQEYTNLTQKSIVIQKGNFEELKSESDYHSGGCATFIWIGCTFLSGLFFADMLSYATEADNFKDFIQHFYGKGAPPFLDVIITLLMFCLAIYAVYYFIKMLKDYHQFRREIQKKNQAIKERNRREHERLKKQVPLDLARFSERQRNIRIEQAKLKREWANRTKYLQTEYQKVSELLEETYSANIVPSHYRNLAAVYYMYEDMSTSSISFESMLMHTHMEDGIQRILKKLDKIIEQNAEIIFQNRMIEANTRKISDQTTQMLSTMQRQLESQERTEASAYEAAQYAQIASDYSKANAYFSLATYLKY